MKILVIDDSRSNLSVLTHLLQRHGHEVRAVDSGYAGLDAFHEERPELVLLDVILPDIVGFDVARKMRESEPKGEWTPIVFLSALSGDEDLEKGISSGGDDYLFKPISEVVLMAKVRAMQRILQMRYSLLVLTRELDSANQQLKRLTAIDGLTGIANRRHFDETLLREWRRAQRQKSPLSLILCDIDHFKKFNDSLGHQAGDACLTQVAEVMARSLDRGADLVARYGGEEFVVVLPETTLEGAAFVAERLRQLVSALSIRHPDSPLGRVSISLGVAAAHPGERDDQSPPDLIKAADQALYQAKHTGRNRVIGYRAPPLSGNNAETAPGTRCRS